MAENIYDGSSGRAMQAANSAVRDACRAAVVTALDIIEGKQRWIALSHIDHGGMGGDSLRDRVYALREQFAAVPTQEASEC